MSKSKLINFTMPTAVHGLLRTIAAQTGLSQSAVARTAMLPTLNRLYEDLKAHGNASLQKYSLDLMEAEFKIESESLRFPFPEPASRASRSLQFQPQSQPTSPPPPRFPASPEPTLCEAGGYRPIPVYADVDPTPMETPRDGPTPRPPFEPKRKNKEVRLDWNTRSVRCPEYDDPYGILPFAPGEKKSDLSLRLNGLCRAYGVSLIQVEEAMQGTNDIDYSNQNSVACGAQTMYKIFDISPLMNSQPDEYVKQTVTGWLCYLVGVAYNGGRIVAGKTEILTQEEDDELMEKYAIEREGKWPYPTTPPHLNLQPT